MRLWSSRAVGYAVAVQLVLACSSKGSEPTDDKGASLATPTDPSLTPWPAAGVCPLGSRKSKGQCEQLEAADGRAIRGAIRQYLDSDAALRHQASDREAASRALGEPHLVSHANGLQPKLGDYYVYAGDGDQQLRLQNTVSMTDGRRWGYRFDLRRTGDSWNVSMFNRWSAWRKRPTSE